MTECILRLRASRVGCSSSVAPERSRICQNDNLGLMLAQLLITLTTHKHSKYCLLHKHNASLTTHCTVVGEGAVDDKVGEDDERNARETGGKETRVKALGVRETGGIKRVGDGSAI